MHAVKEDLWDLLKKTEKKIFLYGMGNGGDKLLSALETKGIHAEGVFVSDEFLRDKCFHGMKLRGVSELLQSKEKETSVLLLSFGSSRPEVLEKLFEIDRQTEFYAPDLPCFGDTLFDREFFNSHLQEWEAVRALFSDEASRRLFDEVLAYKCDGKISHLQKGVTSPKAEISAFVLCEQVDTYLDVGAYTGDTVREFLELSEKPMEIYAVEPDEKSFQKLSAYAEKETRGRVHPLNVCAWNEDTVLSFDKSGNRNSSLSQERSSVLKGESYRKKEVSARRLDGLLQGIRPDFIKYDVEGAEAEALLGSQGLILDSYPTLLVSLYHKSEDLFALPLLIREKFPGYDGFFLRRAPGVPAWDLNLFVKKSKNH